MTLEEHGSRKGSGLLTGTGRSSVTIFLPPGLSPRFPLSSAPVQEGAAYSPALTDFVFMVEGLSQMYITGPDVIRTVTGEQVSHEQLGGASTHAAKSGNIHFACRSEKECMEKVEAPSQLSSFKQR